MKIADYGKAITSYIESPTTAQKLKSKESAENLLAEVDFSGMTVPQLRILYERYTGVGAPKDPKELIIELKRLMKNLDQDGVPFATGGRVHLAEGSEDIVEPSKSMQVDTTTKGLDLFTIDNFKDKAEIYVGALYNGALPTADIKSALNKFTQKGIDDGTFTADDAIKVVQDLKFQFQDRAQKQRLRDNIIAGTGTVEREEQANGGRMGFDPGGPVRKQELIKVLSDAGVKLNPTNFSKSAKELGIQLDTENPLHRTTQPVYVEPTKKELKEIKIKQDKRDLQNFKSGAGKKAYELREKRMIELLKKGELTLQEIDNAIRQEFGKSSMTTILKLKKDLNVEIPSGIIKGIKNPKTKEIIKDLLILKDNKKLNDIFLKKDFNLIRDLPELQKVASKILKNSKASPIRRVGQLLLAYSGVDPELQKYIGKVDDDLVKASSVVKSRVNKSNRLLATLEKLAAEKTSAIELGKPPAFFGNMRKRLNEIINDFKRGLNIQVDEIKAIGGGKAKTPAYNLFVQGIKDTINQDKGNTLDRITQEAELNLQNAKTQKEKIKIKNQYNAQVKLFVDRVNKNLKPGQLPIRAFEISFDKPSETIKNKEAYKKYKNQFDDVYKKYGYSFKVPKDVMTNEQAKAFLKTDKGKNLLTKQTKLGSKRVFSVLPAPVVLPATAYFAGDEYRKGEPALDIASSALLGVKPTESIVRALTPEEEGGFSETEKLARKKLNILKTVKPSDITTIASLAAQDPEYEGAPAKYLDFLKSQNLESIVEPAEKEFQEKVMIPFRETKKAQREPVISGLNELINQFSTKKYDSEEIL